MSWFHGKNVSINLANVTSIVWNEKHPNGKIYCTRVNLSAGMAAMPNGDLFESCETINELEDRRLLASFVGYLLPLLGEIPKLEQEKPWEILLTDAQQRNNQDEPNWMFTDDGEHLGEPHF